MGLMAIGTKKIGGKALKGIGERLSRIGGRAFTSGMMFGKSPAGVYAKTTGARLKKQKLDAKTAKQLIRFAESYDNQTLANAVTQWLRAPSHETQVRAEAAVWREVARMQARWNAGRLTSIGAATAAGGTVAYNRTGE